jgi:hypothetical protein
VTQFDLVNILEEFTKLGPIKGNEQLIKILESIKQFNLEFTTKRRSDPNVDIIQNFKFLSSIELQQPMPSIPPNLEQNYRLLFEEWLHLYQQQRNQIPPRADKIFATFAQTLVQQNILGTENESAFYRFCFENAIEKCFAESTPTTSSTSSRYNRIFFLIVLNFTTASFPIFDTPFSSFCVCVCVCV